MTIATMRLLGALLSAGRDVVETSTRELAGSRNDRLELWRFGRHLVRRGLVERVDQGRGGRGCRTVWRILDLPGLRQLGNVYGVRTQSTEPDPKDVSGARAVEACRKSYRGAQWSIEKGELDTPEGCLAVWKRAVKAGLMPDSEHSRFQFFAAVGRARRVARSLIRFVAAFVRWGLWRKLCCRDEDIGGMLLKSLAPPPPRTLRGLLEQLTGHARVEPTPRVVGNWWAQQAARRAASTA